MAASSQKQVGKSQLEGKFCVCVRWSIFMCITDIGLTEALVDSAADKDDEVRDSIYKSIVDIGRKKHAQVLTILHNYLSKRNKVGVAER